MAYSDLRDFISALEKAGELKRVPFEVDPVLEITEFADRSVKNNGPALLFEKPKGYNMPVLVNAFASQKRMELALEVGKFQEIADRISDYLQMQMPQGLLGKLTGGQPGAVTGRRNGESLRCPPAHQPLRCIHEGRV